LFLVIRGSEGVFKSREDLHGLWRNWWDWRLNENLIESHEKQGGGTKGGIYKDETRKYVYLSMVGWVVLCSYYRTIKIKFLRKILSFSHQKIIFM